MELVVSTRNRDKFREISDLFLNSGIDLSPIEELAPDLIIEEDGRTVEENAIKKAKEGGRATGVLTLSEDSALEIEFLKGAPGIYSSRFARKGATYRENCERVLELMEGVKERRAVFRCVCALYEPEGKIYTFEGRCEGRIATAPKGEDGFGYDPIFIPLGYDKTFAELGIEVKNRISHRAKAVRKVIAFLKERFSL